MIGISSGTVWPGSARRIGNLCFLTTTSIGASVRACSSPRTRFIAASVIATCNWEANHSSMWLLFIVVSPESDESASLVPAQYSWRCKQWSASIGQSRVAPVVNKWPLFGFGPEYLARLAVYWPRFIWLVSALGPIGDGDWQLLTFVYFSFIFSSSPKKSSALRVKTQIKQLTVALVLVSSEID